MAGGSCFNFAVWAGLGGGGGGAGAACFMFCCLGGGRVLSFAVGAGDVLYFFAVWAGPYLLFLLFGRGREFTHLQACLAGL